MLVSKSPRGHIAVYFIGGNMDKPLHPNLSRHLEQGECSHHVGFNDGRGFVDASIHMGFGCEVDHSLAAGHDRFNRKGITDIPFDKSISGIVREGIEVSDIASVSKLVVINDRILVRESEDKSDEIGADESCATRHQEFHEATFPRAGAVEENSLDILFAPVLATRVLARNKDSKVPASVHQPSRISYVSLPSSR